MKSANERELVRVAKQELRQWVGLPNGLALAILWSFIYRVTRGRSIEEDFFGEQTTNWDWEI